MGRFVFVMCCLLGYVALNAQPDSIYSEPDMVPLFAGCADPLVSDRQQQDCSAGKIAEFVRRELRYPPQAQEARIEGTAVVRFVVDEQGHISTAELLREPGGGCGEEALRIVRLLPRFTPAVKQGRPVAAYMILPIRFQILAASSSQVEGFYQLHWGTAYGDRISRAELTELMNLPLVIRDNNGNAEYSASEVELNFLYKNKVSTERGNSNRLTPAMFRLLQRAKSGSVLTFSVHFLVGMQRIEVFREFEVY